MAGVGIRSTEFARTLTEVGDVTLAAVPGSTNPLGDEVTFVEYEYGAPQALKPHIDAADVVVCQPNWPIVMRWLRRSGARIIFDNYVPEIFEVLEGWKDHPAPVRELVGALITDRALAGFHIGHHFLCASEKQRDMWLGAMMAERLIRFDSYHQDPTFRSVIDVVPYGIPDAPPEHPERSVIREKFPAIGETDRIALWNGGLWGWLDPLSPIRAIAEIAKTRSDIHLVFMGAATHRPAVRATEEAKSLARELGVLDRHVFFNDEWVAYERRGDWLTDADIAVSCHAEHLETHFAFRTRLLDCFWARLPIVCTEGDDLASLVERRMLGTTVPPEQPDALARAIEETVDRGRDAYLPGLDLAAETHTWRRVCEPLVRFVEEDGPRRRLDDSISARAARRPTQRLRALGYRVARTGLNKVGLKDWPSQGMDDK